MTDSVPEGTVPEDQAPDQNVVVDERTPVSQRDFDIVRRSNGNTDLYRVVEADDSRAEDPEPDVPEDDTDAEAQDGEGEADAKTPDEDAQEPDETVPEDSTPDEGEPEDQDEGDGYEYGELGGKRYRKDKDGNVEFEMKLDGETEWLNSESYHKNIQFNVHNQRKAQELAEREKKVATRENFDSTLNRFFPDAPAAPAAPQGDDVNDADFEPGAPTAPAAANDEVTALKQRVEELEAKGSDDAATIALGHRIDSAWDSAEAYCKKMDIPVPFDRNAKTYDKALLNGAAVFAENKGCAPADVMSDPNMLSELFASMSRRKSPADVKPSSEGVPKPPDAAKPGRKSSGPSKGSELDKAQKELARLRKKQSDGEVKDQSKHATAILKTNRKVQSLSK